MQRVNAKQFIRAGAGVWLLLAVLVVGWLLHRDAPAGSVQAAPVLQDGRTVSFTNPQYFQDENAGAVAISVQVSPALTDTTVVTVEYLTTPGTATAGVDYVSASGVLTFTQSSGDQNFVIDINDDNNYEGEDGETVNLILRNPTNATLGSRDTAFLTILDDDPAPTNTPTATSGAPPVYVDEYEPNNDLAEAQTIIPGGSDICELTLWPTGDEDFFRFVGKPGTSYEVFTSDLAPGLDTFLRVYDTDGNVIATNDDDDTGDAGDRSSRLIFEASTSGFYYAQITNRDPSDPTDKTYCLEVDELPPLTPTPSQTPVPGADDCEFNSTLDTACLIGVGETLSMSFVPVYGSAQDTDVFRLWMKAGIQYTCETFDLSAFADTNMIFLNENGNDFQPPLGNDDKELGDFGSELSILAPYTGWLYVVVGPVNPPAYEESFLHTYDIQCTSSVVTPTPTPTATFIPATLPPGPPPATSTSAAPSITPFPSPTPIDFSFLTPSPTATPPAVQFQPLPTATPFGGGQQNIAINVTVYYDTNFNFLPEMNEGIMDVAVALYDNASGSLIAFGSTNEAGSVSFTSLTAAGPVRVVAPFLNYNQVVVGGSSNILLRVAPQPLPIGIP